MRDKSPYRRAVIADLDVHLWPATQMRFQ